MGHGDNLKPDNEQSAAEEKEMDQRLSIEKFLERFKKIYQQDLEVIEWNGYCGSITFKCPKCEEIHVNSQARNLIQQTTFCMKNSAINKKMTKEEFIRRLNIVRFNEIEILKYNGLSNPLEYKCLKCGQKKKICVARQALSRFSLCDECEGKEKEVVKKKIDKIFKNNNNFKLLVWRGVRQKSDVQCLKCGTISKRYPCNIISDPKYCFNCNNKTENKAIKLEQAQERIIQSFGENEYEILSYDNFSQRKSRIKCLNCGFIFNACLSTFCSSRGCPKCRRAKSKGEQLIQKILEKNNLTFESQKHFKDCNNNRSSFDFCVYTNTSQSEFFLIEVNGQQHYQPVPYFGGIENQTRRDNIKKEYCKNKNIFLLEIPYWILKNPEEVENQILSYIRSTTISEESKEESVCLPEKSNLLEKI
jgi:hypothetical protein